MSPTEPALITDQSAMPALHRRIMALEAERDQAVAACDAQAKEFVSQALERDAKWRRLLDGAETVAARLTGEVGALTAAHAELSALYADQAQEILRLKARVLDLLDAAAARLSD